MPSQTREEPQKPVPGIQPQKVSAQGWTVKPRRSGPDSGPRPRISFSRALQVLVLRWLKRKLTRYQGLQKPTERLDSKIKREQKRQMRYMVASALLLVSAGVVFMVTRPGDGDRARDVDLVVAISSLAGLAIASFGASMDKRRLVKRLEDDLREMEFEEELERTDNGEPGKRAEKLLSINQHQLRRYYEQNLSHGSWIFFVGVVCLVSGLALVGATLWLLTSGQVSDEDSKWLVAVVGGLGSVLTNYVAAVYLKMHAAATASLTGFHGRLVATHELFFANVLASRTRVDRRDEITCQMALAIVQGTRGAASQAPKPEGAAAS